MRFSINKVCPAVVSFLFCIIVFTIPAFAGYLYVAIDSTTANTIYGFSVNENTGELTLLNGFPLSTGFVGSGLTNLELAVADPVNKRLYVGNRGSSNVSVYSIDPATGALTPLSFSPIATVANERTLKVHPSGSPLIIGADNFASFVIGASSATPAPGSPYTMPTGVSPSASAMSPDGTYYYAGGNSGSFFAGYSVNAATGEMSALAGSPFDSGSSNPVPFAVDQTGRLFVSSSRQGLVRVYTLASGVPTAVTGSPFSGVETGFASLGKIHPNGSFFVLPNRTRNHVYSVGFSGSGAATALSVVPGSPFLTGGSTSQAALFNSAGTFLFVANGTSRNLTRFSVDAATGVLSNQSVQAANTLGTDGAVSGIAYVDLATASVPVRIGGRVTAAGGYPVSRAIVTIHSSDGATRSVVTNTFGLYSFEGVLTGSTYTVSVTSKAGIFPSQQITPAAETLNLDFASLSK